MRISKTLTAASTTGYVVDLRAVGDTTSPFNKVGSVRVTSLQTGGAAGDIWVKFITVAPGGTPPSAPTTPAPGTGLVADWVHLHSDAKSSTTWGNDFGLGYNPAAQGLTAPATHVEIFSVAAGDVVIEAN